MTAARIIIVEDDVIIAMDHQSRVESLGHTVTANVTSAEAALAKVEADRPDLILMDIVIKGEMDGIEAAEVIRSKWEIPVVFVTAYANQERLKRAKLVVPFSYLLKPFQDRDIKLTIEMALYVALVDGKRKQAEEALRESENEHRDLFETMAQGVVYQDTDGSITEANPAAERILGLTLDQMQGRTSIDPRWRAIHEDGSEFPGYERADAIKDHEGNIIGLIGLIRDVTERKKAEEERLHLQAQVQEAQRMESLGVLAGGVAHDFNNMLGVISGFAELTLEAVDSSSVEHGYVEQMQVAAARAAQTVEQILIFSRRTDAEKRVVSLGAIVEESVKLLRSILPASIVLRHEILGEIPGVMADASKIQQVIMNLATNARHAMWSEGGELSLLLTTHRVDATATKTKGDLGISEGNYAHLAVRDTGAGIPPEIRERIFEPFFTTKGVGKGSGMGLATSYGIVASHGGFVTVDSELGAGSVFHIYLPATAAEVKPDGDIARDAGEKVQGKERVLVVDDEPAVLRMTSIMLQKLGYSVTPFSDSCAALDALRQSPHSWEALVTDQTMPGLNGIEMLKAARILRADLPVVIMTGHSDKLAETADGGVGADTVLKKPFFSAGLAAVLRYVLHANCGDTGTTHHIL